MKKFIIILPLIILIMICVLLLIFILSEKNPSKPPSALINKSAPWFIVKNLYNDTEFLNNNDLKNKFVLINFFASWCNPCKLEHPLFFLIKNKYPDLFLLGINFKDKNGKNYLLKEGNPYSFVGADKDGKIGLDFGVFGLPETFLINNEGKIIYKHIGPLTAEIINEDIKPFL